MSLDFGRAGERDRERGGVRLNYRWQNYKLCIHDVRSGNERARSSLRAPRVHTILALGFYHARPCGARRSGFPAPTGPLRFRCRLLCSFNDYTRRPDPNDIDSPLFFYPTHSALLFDVTKRLHNRGRIYMRSGFRLGDISGTGRSTGRRLLRQICGQASTSAGRQTEA